ncbi:polysaccharide biosynthesis protein [Siphonobacter sp. SORGH_AS_1065]|uniref:polysaccharide biosynthesis protein n=1 Tax=Siphonobacter sp. SORGH_AS_1065 TaxID=3041795 RepID=UPI0027873067|nr:polysaccharide biosynthesis protein [Siphonobacter sp. SORGH_AS_1065]MDQ1085600.1 O-antigen/teichoic acid export membrane protein [Siphonobacter sp. SORGH_AS_1065]
MHYSIQRWIELVRLATYTGLAQGSIQVLSLLSGILVIRLLPTQEYAVYTLANTMLGTMTVLADGGISAGVMAQGAAHWNNPRKLGQVIQTGVGLKNKLAFLSLMVAVPVLVGLLRHHQVSWIISVLIVISLIPAFIATLTNSLLQVAPKLHQDVVMLQKNQVQGNIARLGLTVVGVYSFAWAWVAILAAGISQLWANRDLKKRTYAYVDWSQDQDADVKRFILSFIGRILPGALYYCVSGQLVVWLASFYNTTEAVAQVGALGRLTTVLGLFVMVANTLLVPRFARLPAQASLLLKRYLQTHALFLGLGVIVCVLVGLFPNQVLYILGRQYAGLGNELLLNTIGTCLGVLAGISFSLCTSRGWALAAYISIPVNVISILAGLLFIKVDSLAGNLTFYLAITVVQVLMNAGYGLFKIINIPSVKEKSPLVVL